jgi:hypothetical protein
MQKRMNLILAVAILVSLLVSACAPAATPAPPAPTATPVPPAAPTDTPVPPLPTDTPEADVALKIRGGERPAAWAEDELRAMDTLDVDYTDKDGTTTTYTGVPMKTLLEIAGVAESLRMVLVASDGYTAEVTIDDVMVCDDCIVAFDPEGGLRSVLPGHSSAVQVKGLIEIRLRGTMD